MLKAPLFFDRVLLFADLDSTLIYSHRHPYDGECVWVEELHSHPQSFMTQRTYQFFLTQNWLYSVPLTTRNHAQYQRLQAAAGQLHLHEALICNGAVLLRENEEDSQWRMESEQLAEPVIPELHRLQRLAETLAGREQVIVSEPFLFYVRSDNPETVFRALRDAADPEQFAVRRDARKVYCIPRAFGKEKAALRYCRRIGAKRFLAAGDSAFDTELLLAADVGFCPDELREQIGAAEHLCGCSGWFSDTLCEKLDKLKIEENWID